MGCNAIRVDSSANIRIHTIFNIQPAGFNCKKKGLNTFTLNAQKAHRTSKCVLKFTYVDTLWYYVVEETGGNHQPWVGEHCPDTCRS